jgi:4-diphosphocytidyl-2-C-methyl-D-erythritol kinase
MKLLAAAKINWTLEVLGRRGDGYHEVRTVMQTIDLCDELELEPGEGLELEVDGPHEATEDDLVLRAAALLEEGRGRGAQMRLTKRIPVAAGLGGGSSDAAAALRGLNHVRGLGHDTQQLAALASQIGSDVAFFLAGGTALAEGRGERVTPLPDAAQTWLVLLVPPLHLAEKTRRMYEALTPADFTDGSRTGALVERIRNGEGVRENDLFNAFERAAYEVFEGLEGYREALLAAGARRVHLAGAGPALFALAEGEAPANAIRDKVSSPDGRLFVVRTLGAAESQRREG